MHISLDRCCDRNGHGTLPRLWQRAMPNVHSGRLAAADDRAVFSYVAPMPPEVAPKVSGRRLKVSAARKMAGMMRADVAVVGAGPAGAATATHLARSGKTVVLLDKATFPRDKTCGDGLTGNALRRLERLGLDPSPIPSWQAIDQVVVRVPDGRQVPFPFPRDGGQFVAAARRVDLDAALVELARSAGVTVLEGDAVVDVTTTADSVTVTCHTGDQVAARYVVAADGIWSPIRRLCGLAAHGYRGDAYALRQYYQGVGPAASDLWVWFEEELRPGYGWSFPLGDGGANVGIGVLPDRSSALKRHWENFAELPHVQDVLGPDARPDGPIRMWPIPAHIGRSPLTTVDGRVLFVGDAARAADALTGEGIGQALETAELAARAIDDAGPRQPQRAARAYRRSVKLGLALDSWIGDYLSAYLANTEHPSRWMNIATAHPRIQRHFPRIMFEDYPRALALTPQRWRRGALHPPGAFGSIRQDAGPAPS